MRFMPVSYTHLDVYKRQHQHKAVLYVLKTDFALVLEIATVLLEIGVDLCHKRRPHRLFRRTAVLEEAGVVVILEQVDFVGKAQRDVKLDLCLLYTSRCV